MAHSPVYHVVFGVISIMVLKEVNAIVTEPYMVCVVLRVTLHFNRTCTVCRTNPSTYPRSKRTVKANGPLGIQRSPPLPDCMSHPAHMLP